MRKAPPGAFRLFERVHVDDCQRIMIALRQVRFLGAILFAATFMLSVGDRPWHSFWREWVASLAILLMVLAAANRMRDEGRPLRVELRSLPTLAIMLAVACWFQWAMGRLAYRGDALLASAYLVAFAACIAIARSLRPEDRARLADDLALAMLVAALCSAPIAALQWIGTLRLELGIPVVGGRPVAHMEQTNLLCSLVLQGLFGAWRLHERGRLPRAALQAIGVVLLAVAVLTQSRVAWLVAIAVLVAWAWRQRHLALRSRGRWLAIAAGAIALGAVLLPLLDRRLGLAGMDLAERTSGGRRPDVWALFLDAVRVHPWAGWGALQNGEAQFALADRHPSLMWLFSSAHDVVLDLMVWFGAPAGLICGGALVVAIIRRVRGARDAAAFVTALAAGALLLHGLVELPLQYTYFLLPFGLMLGAVDEDVTAIRAWRLPMQGPLPFALLALLPALLLALLARDYIALSEARPRLEYDKAADHMVLGAPFEVPDVLMLDQLQAFQAFARVPMRAGADDAVLAALRRPMLRFPLVQAQERYARIMALNGRVDVARDTLRRECGFMPPPSCREYHRAWRAWQAAGEPLPDWP